MDRSEFENDPELQELFRKFLVSFEDRVGELKEGLGLLEKDQESARVRVRRTIHRLTGACGSYGFPSLSKLSEVLDVYLESDRVSKEGIEKAAVLMMDILAEAKDGQDRENWVTDPRMGFFSE